MPNTIQSNKPPGLAIGLFFFAIAATVCLADRAPIHPNPIEAERQFLEVLDSFVEQRVDGPYCYRVLVPYMEWALHSWLRVSPLVIDFFLKLALLTACQWVFWSYLTGFLGLTDSLLGVAFLDLFIMANLSTGAGQWPSESAEIANVLTIALSVSLCRSGKYLTLLTVLFVGTINRETTWLVLPLLFAETRTDRKRPFWLLAAVAAITIPYLLLRQWIESPTPVWWTTESIAENVPFISPESTPAAIAANIRLGLSLGPFVALGLYRFREHTPFLKHTFWIVPPYFLVHYLVGNIVEIRLWVPLLIVLLPLALATMRRVREGSEVTSPSEDSHRETRIR